MRARGAAVASASIAQLRAWRLRRCSWARLFVNYALVAMLPAMRAALALRLMHALLLLVHDEARDELDDPGVDGQPVMRSQHGHVLGERLHLPLQ